MMRYSNFQGITEGSCAGMAPFMWFIYILVAIVLVLGAFALWKYINKK